MTHMKPRDLAFTMEAVSRLPGISDDLFTKFEKAALFRMQEFLPHYLIKIMVSFNRAQQGSGELFSQLIENINQNFAMLSYTDAIRYFELYPRVSYLYDHTMSSELHAQMLDKFSTVLGNHRALPTEDISRIFNILVQTTPYRSADEVHVSNEVFKRLRSNLHAIPKEHFAQTLCNLAEFQNPDIAEKAIKMILH